MAVGLEAFSEGDFEVIPIHFDVPDHHLPLKTFIETASQTEAVIAALNEKLFDGRLQYEILVLPPEVGTFKTKLAIVCSTFAAFWALVESDSGKGLIKGLTGHEPSYWTELAGQKIRQKIVSSVQSASTEREQESQEHRVQTLTQAIIIVESTKSFLQKDTDDLSRIGVQPPAYRDAFEARNLFYKSCYDNSEIRSIGFEEAEHFPIKRSDFARLQVALPPREEEPEQHPWHVEIAALKVTSPNWDRSDKQRLWKGRDSQGREKLFKIEDENFWHLAKEEKLNLHVIDIIKVQWAFQIVNNRPRDIRVLAVLEYNDEVLTSPLNENALNIMLGQFEASLTTYTQQDFFRDLGK